MPNRSPPRTVDGAKRSLKPRRLKASPALDSLPPAVIEVNGIPRWEQPLCDLQENGCMSPISAEGTSSPFQPCAGTSKPNPKHSRTRRSGKCEYRGRSRTSDRMNLENTVLTINMDRQKSIGDLTIDMPNYSSPRKTPGTVSGSSMLQGSSSSLAAKDLSGHDEKTANPLWSNGHYRKQRKSKGKGRTRRHSDQVEPKSTSCPTDDQVSLSELYASWKDGSCSSSQDHSHQHSSTSDLSSVTSLLDEAYVFGGKKYPANGDEARVIEMQEEEMLQLAMERSVEEFSLHSGTKSTNSESSGYSTYDSSCSVKAYKRITRPPRRTKSKLAGAGCHLSMMASDQPISRRRSEQSSLRGGTMLNSFGNLSDEEDDQMMLPAPAPDPAFIWKRDTQTKKWYKKPIASTNTSKSEEDILLEKVSELSMKDCLTTSLNELQSVAFQQYKFQYPPAS